MYIEIFVFLKVARRGAIAPLAPLNPPLIFYCLKNFEQVVAS